jgi:hypothetical protein
MADQEEDDKKSRTRSPAYPFINLAAALKRAKEFYSKEQRNAASVKVAVKHWGYDEKSSGGKQTTAALINYGLFRDEGIGERRKVQLTQDALRVILDERPDSTEREQLIKKLALTPKINKELWAKWGHSLPSDGEIRHTLLVDWNPPFNDKAVDGFIRLYKDTIAFAKLGESDQAQLEGNAADSLKMGDFVQWELNGVLQLPEPMRIQAFTPDRKFAILEGSHTGVPVEQLLPEEAPAGAGTTTPPVDYRPAPSQVGKMQKDIFSLKEGEVVLFWPSPLSEDSVKDVTDWLEIVKRKFARAVPAKDAAKD